MKKIDFHVHINCPIPLADTVGYFEDMCARHGYCGVGLMSLIYGSGVQDPMCNGRALELKSKMPGSFAFASLDHDIDFTAQTKNYMRSGFDGIKLLEGKPSVYRHYGYGLDDSRFDGFFEYAQSAQIPVLLHNCDPADNWDITKVDERAVRHGWYYDEKVPPRSYFFEALERVLQRYPQLCLCIAHMGFYADRLDKASGLLERHPNLYFDITPALIIYRQLSANPDATAFFEKYCDRLIYGTDADNELTGFAREYNDKKVRVITAFLEKDEPCVIDGIQINPLGLSPDMLEKIYYKNALCFMKK